MRSNPAKNEEESVVLALPIPFCQLLIGRPGDTRNSQAWKDAKWPTLLVFQMDPETPGNIKQLQGTGDNSPKRQDPKHGHATLK